MKPRNLINTVIFVMLHLAGITSLVAGTPNLVIFYADDLGYGDLGSYGHPIVKTPNIDTLAKQGIQYSQYYAPAPLCSPSRAAMLTGRTPYRTGVRSWIPDGQNVHIGENEITIAHLLQQQGYQTAVMGKLHLNGGPHMKDHPQAGDLGFDHSFVIHGGWAKNAATEAATQDGNPRQGKIYPDNYWRNGNPVGETGKFSAELVSDEVISWLDSIDGDKPFFIYVPYSEVHVPIASPQRFLSMYSDYISDYANENPDTFHFDFKSLPYRGSGEYFANISFMDEQLGRVLGKLDEMGKSDETIVVFTSDNGPVTKESRKPWELSMAGETGGLRGRKDNLFEGGIRVPAIIRYPAAIRAGQVSAEPVHGVDLLPTMAELLEFQVPGDRVLDGQSITATFDGNSVERKKPLFWTIDMPDQDDPVNEWAIRDGDWKMILDRNERPKYLFNIPEDPYEMYNLLDKQTEKAQSLQKQFMSYKNSIENDVIARARKISD